MVAEPGRGTAGGVARAVQDVDAQSAASRASARMSPPPASSCTSETASRTAASRSRRPASSPATAWRLPQTRGVPFEPFEDFDVPRALCRSFGSGSRTTSLSLRFRDWSDGATYGTEDGSGGWWRAGRSGSSPRPVAFGSTRLLGDGGRGLRLLGLPFELDPFHGWASDGDPSGWSGGLGGFRPTLNPAVRGARCRDHDATDLLRAAAAIRGRFVQRFGVGTRSRGSSSSAKSPRGPLLGTSSSSSSRARRSTYVLGLDAQTSTSRLSPVSGRRRIAAYGSLPGLGRWTADLSRLAISPARHA